jgi:hypothetical protein
MRGSSASQPSSEARYVPTMRWRSTAAIAVLVMVGGCNLLSPIPDLTSGADSTSDAAPEGAVPDGAPNGDAVPGAPCEDATPLVGSATVAGSTNEIPASFVDAYGFAAPASAFGQVARCAWVYMNVELPPAASIFVFSHDAVARTPGKLLAIARIDAPVTGWNRAPLDVAVPLSESQVLWLGLHATSGVLRHPTTAPADCAGKLLRATAEADAGAPGAFTATTPGGQASDCEAATFLGR